MNSNQKHRMDLRIRTNSQYSKYVCLRSPKSSIHNVRVTSLPSVKCQRINFVRILVYNFLKIDGSFVIFYCLAALLQVLYIYWHSWENSIEKFGYKFQQLPHLLETTYIRKVLSMPPSNSRAGVSNYNWYPSVRCS